MATPWTACLSVVIVMVSVLIGVGFVSQVSEAARALARKIKEERDRRCKVENISAEAAYSMDARAGALTNYRP